MTIKAQTKKLLPQLQQESQQKREERAAIELNPQNIRMMIFEAARAGQTARRVKMPSNLDVRGTVAYEALKEWCKAESLELIWEKRNVDLEDGRRSEIVEPEISWQPKA